MGRKKATETLEEPKKAKAAKKATKKKGDDNIKTLEEVEKALLKKCKKDGFINQSEIYDALNDYELDEDAVETLIAFFAENEIEVLTSDEDEEEEEDKEEEFDESKMSFDENADDDDDFFVNDEGDEDEEEDIDIDHLDVSLGSEVRINAYGKRNHTEIDISELVIPEEGPILAKKSLDGGQEAK